QRRRRQGGGGGVQEAFQGRSGGLAGVPQDAQGAAGRAARERRGSSSQRPAVRPAPANATAAARDVPGPPSFFVRADFSDARHFFSHFFLLFASRMGNLGYDFRILLQAAPALSS